MTILPTDALIVVDVQNDFCPGGALPVDEGHHVVPIINLLLRRFDLVVFTRDWHPHNHCSFGDPPEFTDGSWPEHCRANSPGAEFHGDLRVPVDAIIVNKGTDPDQEAYSGFQGTPPLADELRQRGVTRIFVCGLATDYWVKDTALDGLAAGFDVFLVENACRGVNFPEGSVTAAVEEMRRAGIKICWSGDLTQ